jgi:hypothetical protein
MMANATLSEMRVLCKQEGENIDVDVAGGSKDVLDAVPKEMENLAVSDKDMLGDYYDVKLGKKACVKVELSRRGEAFLWFCKIGRNKVCYKRTILWKNLWAAFKITGVKILMFLENGEVGTVKMRISNEDDFEQCLEVFQFEGATFVCISQYDSAGLPGNSANVNMTVDEFKTLMRLSGHIDSLIVDIEKDADQLEKKTKKPKKVRKCAMNESIIDSIIRQTPEEREKARNRGEKVTFFRLIRVCTGELAEGPWTSDEVKCITDKEEIEKCSPGVDCWIDAREFFLPCTFDLLDLAFRSMVQIGVHQLGEFHCEGCRDDEPGQAGHMDFGCLTGTQDLLEAFSRKAGGIVSVQMLCELYSFGMEMLKLQKSTVTSLIAAAVVQERLVKSVEFDELDEDCPFIQLYSEVYKKVTSEA